MEPSVGRGFCPSQERGFLQGKSFSLRALPIMQYCSVSFEAGRRGNPSSKENTEKGEHTYFYINYNMYCETYNVPGSINQVA
jgi:hypothetical protein